MSRSRSTHILAEHRRRRRDADVELAAVDLDLNLAVLRPPALDDVHVGEHLDAGDEWRRHGRGKRQDLVEGAVGPARTRTLSAPGSMWTSDARSRTARVEDQVDDLDDRSVLVDLDHRDFRGLGVLPASFLGARLEVAQRVVEVGIRAVAVLERPLDLVLRPRRRWRPEPRALRSSVSRVPRMRGSTHTTCTRSPSTTSGIARSSSRDRGRETAHDVGVQLVPARGRQWRVRAARPRRSRCRDR